MVSFKTLTCFASLSAFVHAECPGACSGHGRCMNAASQRSDASDTLPGHHVPDAYVATYGANPNIPKKDSCTCFTRVEDGRSVYDWTGADCSLRTCPHSHSWHSIHNNNNHNVFQECSGRVECNRKSGRCECFDGFSGAACHRTSCPNECSQHGTCQTLNSITHQLSLASTEYSSLSPFDTSKIRYSTAWDADKMSGCVCDDGFFGPDCSKKRCPSQADPMGGAGSESGRECSGRGDCDHTVGECACYKGYYGAACATQRANSM